MVGPVRTPRRGLYPEAIILDSVLYNMARYSLQETEISPETLAVDVVAKVAAGGHFLVEKRTRKHMRNAMLRSNFQELDEKGKYRDPVSAAREKVRWILENHHLEPPPAPVQKEIDRILATADRELKG